MVRNTADGPMGPTEPHQRATLALVVGLLAVTVGPFLCGIVLGPLAIFLGITAKARIDREPGIYSNRRAASAAVWLGVAGLVLVALFFAIYSPTKK
ncbi:MAG: DUF4190 domain-containing protein [Actinomycetota bacterium]